LTTILLICYHKKAKTKKKYPLLTLQTWFDRVNTEGEIQLMLNGCCCLKSGLFLQIRFLFCKKKKAAGK